MRVAEVEVVWTRLADFCLLGFISETQINFVNSGIDSVIQWTRTIKQREIYSLHFTALLKPNRLIKTLKSTQKQAPYLREERSNS